jgi:hypothetical protein
MRYCDVSPLEVCNVLLAQPYLWKFHDVYESRLHSVSYYFEQEIVQDT